MSSHLSRILQDLGRMEENLGITETLMGSKRFTINISDPYHQNKKRTQIKEIATFKNKKNTQTKRSFSNSGWRATSWSHVHRHPSCCWFEAEAEVRAGHSKQTQKRSGERVCTCPRHCMNPWPSQTTPVQTSLNEKHNNTAIHTACM